MKSKCVLFISVIFCALKTTSGLFEKGALIDEYVVAVTEEQDVEEILQDAFENGLTLKKQILPKLLWLVKINDSNSDDLSGSRDISSRFTSNPKVALFEQQRLLRRVTKAVGTDTEWNNMWYMNGNKNPNMKIKEAWDLGYSGNGVVIAVVDDGIETDQPDLVTNLNTAIDYDWQSDDDDPSPPNSTYSHGTNCAGLIAAEKDNVLCITGAAHGSTIIGIRLIDAFTTDAMEASALVHEVSSVDIYSNSWGPSDGSGFGLPGDATIAAIEDAILNGRGGKGTIYVWAAGNGGSTYNCNADAYVNSIYTVAITSIGYDGEPAFYAEICAPVLAATYGGGGGDYLVSTHTDQSCSDQTLQGTSFATPLASGIIALTLEANPDLTWRDIQHLIVRTSKSDGLEETIGNIGFKENAAGLNISHRFGFGMMDAEALVTKAQTWVTVDPQLHCESGYISVNHILDDQFYSLSEYTMSGCNIKYLEHVVIRVNFQADWAGALQIAVKSPGSTQSFVLTGRPDDTTVDVNGYWDFMSVHFWGENPNGKWKLTSETVQNGYSGIIYHWRLSFYGTASVTESYPGNLGTEIAKFSGINFFITSLLIVLLTD